jgi:hypothetical protein
MSTNTPTWLYWVYLAMHLFVLAPAIGYSYRFHRVTAGPGGIPWWNSLTGRALMMMAVALALNIIPAMLSIVWILITSHTMPGRVAIGAVAYLIAGVALWMQWVAFERAQRPDPVAHQEQMRRELGLELDSPGAGTDAGAEPN